MASNSHGKTNNLAQHKLVTLLMLNPLVPNFSYKYNVLRNGDYNMDVNLEPNSVNKLPSSTWFGSSTPLNPALAVH